ncbi:Hypothetical protein PHPALM_12938 [Phytophthora palmivora]|uniref:Uncharacterized protein n=1 Tax=Phytophthora palmivora TaxID=4796 RepID=A0A2P4XYF8_9STRA|nr:Hypothetical protein PHPALM_12938 [Phytophthora palmivora]
MFFLRWVPWPPRDSSNSCICLWLFLKFCLGGHLRNADWVNEQMLFKVAVDVVPTNVKVLSNEAKNLLNSDPNKALEYLQFTIGMLPKHIESHTNAGLAYVTLASRIDRDDGEELFLHGIRHLYKSAMLAPNTFQSHGFLGGEMYSQWMRKARQQNGEPTLREFLGSTTIAYAIKFLDHAIDHKSIYPTHFYSRGNIAYESGDFDAAISYFRTTEVANGIIRDRKVDPELLVESSAIYNVLGVCYKAKGELNKALEIFRKGIALHAEEIYLHINVALIEQQLGNNDKADAQLQVGLSTVTRRDDIRKLREIAKMLQNSILSGAVDQILDRAATLERQHLVSS